VTYADGTHTLYDSEGPSSGSLADFATLAVGGGPRALPRPAGQNISAASNYPAGTFSITKQKLETYPAGVPKPDGTYRILTGKEYDLARATADATNDAIREAHGLRGSGFDIHEIKPVKFSGSPTDPANKILIDSDLHRRTVTPWWNQLQREIERGL
jgi:hypothetical protein